MCLLHTASLVGGEIKTVKPGNLRVRIIIKCLVYFHVNGCKGDIIRYSQSPRDIFLIQEGIKPDEIGITILDGPITLDMLSVRYYCLCGIKTKKHTFNLTLSTEVLVWTFFNATQLLNAAFLWAIDGFSNANWICSRQVGKMAKSVLHVVAL